MRLLQPRHPGWTGAIPRFDEEYELLGSAWYPLQDARPTRKYFGEGSPRRCAFCGRRHPEASFRKEAHALPVALGNRRLFSREECDSCNDKFSEWESELAAMLAPQRVLGAVPARQGLPKLCIRGRSSIEATSPTGIRIMQHDADKSVFLEIRDKGSGSLTLESPPYSPLKAVHALLHSLWLILDDAQRRRAPELLKAINAPVAANSQFFRFTSPGTPFPRAILSGWLKKRPDFPGATFILQFVFFDTVLCWAWADEAGDEVPTLLAPIPGERVNVHAGKYVLRDLEYRVEESTVTYNLVFEHPPVPIAHEPQSRTAGSRTPKSKPKTRVLLQTPSSASGSPRQLEAVLHAEASESGCHDLRIQGGEWPGSLRLRIDEGGQDHTFGIHFVHHAQPADVALRAAEFLEEVRSSRSLSVKVADGGATLCSFSLGPENVPDLREFMPILRDLALVKRELGADIRFPKRASREFLEELNYVASAIRTGRVQHGSGTASFSLPVADAVKFETMWAQRTAPMQIQFRGVGVTAVLDGHELSLGPCTQDFEIVDLRAEHTSDDVTRLELKFSRKTDVFDVWVREHVSTPGGVTSAE